MILYTISNWMQVLHCTRHPQHYLYNHKTIDFTIVKVIGYDKLSRHFNALECHFQSNPESVETLKNFIIAGKLHSKMSKNKTTYSNYLKHLLLILFFLYQAIHSLLYPHLMKSSKKVIPHLSTALQTVILFLLYPGNFQMVPQFPERLQNQETCTYW